VVLVDWSKLVDRLGAFPVAVEVVPEAVALVTGDSCRSARSPVAMLRGAPAVDHRSRPPACWMRSFHRFDAARWRPHDGVPGVVEHGLFVGMASSCWSASRVTRRAP
jgi:ribose 5-phosphate isomerase